MGRVWWLSGLAVSGALHLCLYGAMAHIPKNVGHESTAMTIASQKKAKKDDRKKEDEPKPPDPKPIKAPLRTLSHAPKADAPPPPQNTPPPPVNSPAANAALAAMPDFGISLAGGTGPGIAVPTGGSGQGTQAAASKSAAPVAHTSVATTKPVDSDPCTEDPVRPKPQTMVKAQYTAEAAAAEIVGKVRVSVTIDASGAVTEAHVVSGLGYGLDQAAIAAAKRMKFSPGTRCGKAVESTTFINTHFAPGD